MPQSLRRIVRTARPAASYVEEEEEDEAPRAAGRAPEPSRRQADDDDDDDGVDYAKLTEHTGWEGSAEQKKNLPSAYAPMFSLQRTQVLVKFLEPAPFYSYLQHWCEWLPARTRLSYVCIREVTDCPLCTVNKPAAKDCYNILDLSEPEKPEVKVWAVSITASTRLKELHDNERSGPLNRPDMYFDVSRTGGREKGVAGSGGPVVSHINAVKERDVKSDWYFDPLTPGEIKEYAKKLYVATDVITVAPKKVLKEVADTYRD